WFSSRVVTIKMTSRSQSPSNSSRSHPFTTGNFSNEEWMDLKESLHTMSIGFLQALHDYASQWQLEYPFEVQLAGGCDLHLEEASIGFIRIAYQGSDLVSFQKNSWLPSPNGGSRAQHICTLFNSDKDALEILHKLFFETCPRFLMGLLDAGKAYLQRQERRRSMVLIFLAVIVPLVLLTGLAFWLRKR
ncbi:hypothetical protein HPG69_006386, partial [Diceros bicornis minor]